MVEITLGRATKIWWSFAWRSMVLSFLVLIPVEAILAVIFFKYIPTKGQHIDPSQVQHVFGVFSIVWLVMVGTMVLLQALGMRWMLKSARWSDFRVAVLPPDGSAP
jgi:heme/copper-type cytochrome/quinol oxidase subunit 2